MITSKIVSLPTHHSGLIWRPRWWRAPLFLAMLAASMMEPVLVQAAGAEAGFSSSQHPFQLSVLSSRPDMVSGGDALVRVDVPRSDPIARVRIFRNDHDVTDAFTPIPAEHALVGLVDGFELGENQLFVRRSGQHRPVARLTIVNHPITGPIFSGPHQQPFVCKTTRPNNDLGQPLVDNQEGIGFPVFDPDGEVIGWSRDCSAHDRVGYMYRATDGMFRPMPPDGSRPPDLAQTTLLDGRRVDYIVRWERGTINRFIYSMAMLAPFGEDPQQPDRSFWNGRLLFSFEGGVGIGRQQGEMSMSGALFNQGLSLGYAVIYSTGTRTGVHYNLQVGGETALMVKEAFIKRHGVPLYTEGVGGSGGGIQQYIYAQNHPGLLDAGIPQYSYPDMVTQGIHIGDCELLEYFMDVTDAANPKWATWTNRRWLEGLNASDTVFNPYTQRPGSTECVSSWRGLTPLMLNPLYGTAGPGQELMSPPGVMDSVHWTHWEDLRNIYGVEDDGYARATWDNVGVQYGLKALRDGDITPAEFLWLNATVGGWKHARDMVQEGAPFIPDGKWDPWSSRNMNLSPDGGATPAPRTEGDLAAMHAAYATGMVYGGRLDIPMIDWRHYLEEELNMHNSRQSFSSRQRMIDATGSAENQVIWFTDARPARAFDQTPEALTVIDEWMRNIREHRERSVAENKPPLAVDRCFTTLGVPIASGDQVWDGILNENPPGACTTLFPLHSTSRVVAGGPLTGDVYKCQLKSVSDAIADGTYGTWVPTAGEQRRLNAIFPTGVCDYSLPDAGRPRSN